MAVLSPVRPVTRGRRPARADVAAWLLLAGTLVWLPGVLSAFVVPKLLLVAVAALVALGATARGELPRPLVLVGVAWLAVLVVATVAGETPVASLVGRWPRYEGLPVLGLYAAAAWTGARVAGRGTDDVRRIGGAVGALSLLLFAVSVVELVGVSPVGPGAGPRGGSLLGNATDQGAVAMMAALLVAGSALSPRRHRWEVVVLVASLGTVALSGSRTALALSLAGLLVTGLGRRAPAVLAAAALVVTALLVPVTRGRLLSPDSATGRWEQWRLSLALVREHALLGVGPSRYLDVFPMHETDSFVRFTGPDVLADSPHSIVLQVLVAGGLALALVSLIGLALVALRVRVAVREQPETAPAALAVGAYLALLLVNPTSAGPVCLAAFLLGSVVAVAPRSGEVDAQAPGAWVERTRQAGGVALLGLVLVLAAACAGELAMARGVAAADEHRVPEARNAFAEAGWWRPWDADVDLVGASVLAQEATRGDAEAAAAGLVLADRALSRLPRSYTGLVTRGVVLVRDGDLDAALATLDAAVDVAPRRPDARVQRAIVRFATGDRAGAISDLRAAAEVAPRSPVVRRLMRRVGG